MFFKKVIKSPIAARDITAQCAREDLSMGQQLIADYEMDVIALPCELAEAIDEAIKDAKQYGYEKAMDGITGYADVCRSTKQTWRA